jgi:hypothetical protein
VILVDDHLIAHRLATGRLGSASGKPPPGVATTCSWWWRLSAALAGTRGGAITRYFTPRVAPGAQSALQRTIARLPDTILILDLRDLIPAMAVLSAQHDLNLLAAEAVVAAEVLGAEVVVRHDTPKIRETAAARGIPYRLDA